MGYLKSVGTAVIYTGFFLAVITFLPGLPPEAEFSDYSIIFPSESKLPFQLQNRLRAAEVLFKGQLKGPECFDAYAGELYTGLHGGYVVKLEQSQIIPIAKFGKKCDGIWQEEKCGRPLGIKFNGKGDLFVVDTYYGIFKLDVRTGQHKLIVNTSEPVEGKIPMIPNSLDIANNGDIYWTDSSTHFKLHDGIYTGLENPSGRLIRYNAAKRKNEVLLDNLAFANGLKLSEDESFVLVAETWASRITKYYLKGSKAGKHEAFAEGLPGLPDNIHTDTQNGYLISLFTYVDAEHPMLMQTLMPHSNIRKLLARLLYFMEAPLKLLHEVYPNPYAERLIHSIGSFEGFQPFDITKRSVVLRINADGEILEALYSDGEIVDAVSSAFVHGDYVWLGSPFAERVLRVPLKIAFPDIPQNRKHTVYIREKRDANQSAKKAESAPAPRVVKPPKSDPTETAKQNHVKTSTSSSTTPTPTMEMPARKEAIHPTVAKVTKPKTTPTIEKSSTVTKTKQSTTANAKIPTSAVPIAQSTADRRDGKQSSTMTAKSATDTSTRTSTSTSTSAGPSTTTTTTKTIPTPTAATPIDATTTATTVKSSPSLGQKAHQKQPNIPKVSSTMHVKPKLSASNSEAEQKKEPLRGTEESATSNKKPMQETARKSDGTAKITKTAEKAREAGPQKVHDGK